MIKWVEIRARECTCDVCDYRWVSVSFEEPRECRNKKCRSREWNGKKKPSHVNEIKMPSPRKRGRRRTIALVDYSELDQ